MNTIGQVEINFYLPCSFSQPVSYLPTSLYDQLVPAFHALPAYNLGSHLDSSRATDSVNTTVGPDHNTPIGFQKF